MATRNQGGTAERLAFVPSSGRGLFLLVPAMTTIERPRAHTETPTYYPRQLESGWQARWRTQGLYRTTEGGGKPKYYVLDFFPYPSGDGLSVGHCRNYVPTDTLSRYFRMRGFNVLHPMGWDAFGEPTEQFAVLTGTSPRVATD